MTKLAASLTFFLALSSAAFSQDRDTCPVPGTMEHWRADYCMSQMETDDIIAAQQCLEKEQQVLFRSDCTAKIHYKREMCRLSVRSSGIGTVEACMRDLLFQGPTVRNHGA